MKRSTIIAAAVLTAGLALTGCSAADGDVSDSRDSRAEVTTTAATERRDDSSSRRTETTTRRVTSTTRDDRDRSSRIDGDESRVMSSAESMADKAKDKAESIAEDGKDKVDEITDDVADGINGGLDAAESLVDDALR